MKYKFASIVIVTILLIQSCKKIELGAVDSSKKPIVTVLENTLYMSDIEGIVSKAKNQEDSAAIVRAYIDMWINDELTYNKAKRNIWREDEIEKLVAEYRRSLITGDYQTGLLKERVSETVSDEDLKMFFLEHQDFFRLTEPIIMGLYLKLPIQSPELANYKKWFQAGTDKAAESIEEHRLQNVLIYDRFYDRWLSFNKLMGKIPKVLTDAEDFLKKNTTLEYSDSIFVHLLHIKEYKLIGADAPYEFVKEDVKEAYLASKRELFLKQLHTDLYNKAVANGQIKYYVK